MREIKFRGYAVDEMIKNQWIYGYGVYPIEFSEDYAKKTGRKKDVYLFTENGEFQIFERSIGQYTGLKDKNGVEIYEGDIVKSQSGTGGLIYKHIVEWNDFYKRFEPMGTDESCFNRENCEVIGNIYENSEVLEELK